MTYHANVYIRPYLHLVVLSFFVKSIRRLVRLSLVRALTRSHAGPNLGLTRGFSWSFMNFTLVLRRLVLRGWSSEGWSSEAGAQKAGPQKAGPQKAGAQKAEPQKAGPPKLVLRRLVPKAGPQKAGPRKLVLRLNLRKSPQAEPQKAGAQKAGPQKAGAQKLVLRKLVLRRLNLRRLASKAGPQKAEPQKAVPESWSTSCLRLNLRLNLRRLVLRKLNLRRRSSGCIWFCGLQAASFQAGLLGYMVSLVFRAESCCTWWCCFCLGRSSAQFDSALLGAGLRSDLVPMRYADLQLEMLVVRSGPVNASTH